MGAQINGYGGGTDTEDKMRGCVEHDLYCIDNFSIWFDVQIILMTLFSRRAFFNACYVAPVHSRLRHFACAFAH